jgi:hypothetical protein
MIILRLFIGIFKGAVVGALLGGGLWYLETGGNLQAAGAPLAFLRWPLYGLVGLLAGVVSGKPPWAKGSAWVSSILKGLFGFGLCVGLYFLLDYLVGGLSFMGRPATAWYFAVGAALGAVYAAFIEVDDSIGKRDEDAKKPKKAEPKKPAKPAAQAELAETEEAEE